MINVDIPLLLETKHAHRHVYTESGYIHVSWILDGGKVIAFEYIPDNYPCGGIVVYDSVEEYDANIADIHWIHDEDYQSSS